MSVRRLGRLGRRCWWALRWFAVEFLVIAIRRDASSILTGACRLIGCAALGGVLWLTLSGGVSESALPATIQYVSSALLAVALGNVAREFASSVCAQVMGWGGRDFTRKGATLNGKTYRETLHPDGTWFRCESGPEGTICEWTDTHGACNRVVTGPRRVDSKSSHR
jgi:hypothetical protein